MTPFTEATAADCGRLGGQQLTPAKRRALRNLHKSRRGVRQSSDPTELMRAVNAALSRGIWTQRMLAVYLGVAERSLYRWLKLGPKFWPRPQYQKKLAAWVAAQV